MRMNRNDPPRISMLNKPIRTRIRGRPKLRYLHNVKEDLRMIRIRGWRRIAFHREKWQEVLRQAKAHNGLERHMMTMIILGI